MTSSLSQAREALERELDIALLDVDLFGKTTFVLARELMAHGTKVVFVTGFEETLYRLT